MIEEAHIRFVAAADVTDDCRVEVILRKARQVVTASQGRELAAELVRAAGEAERAAADLLHTVEPAGFDLLTREPISPDCAAGKLPVHPDEAWDDVADVEVPCQCPCHTEEAAA